MQVVLSAKAIIMEEGGSSKLWRSRSLPANSRDIATSPTTITRATLLKTTWPSSSATRKGLFSATEATGPSALLERRKKVNPALKVEAFCKSDPPPPASKPRTFYEILQVSPLASQTDIKTAYHQSVLQHHPDKAPSHHKETSTLLFIEIKSAYATLKDPLARARYDLQMSLQSFQSSGYRRTSSASTPSSHPYTPRAQSTSSSPYHNMPRAHQPVYTSPSSNYSSPRAQQPVYTSPSSNYYSPRGPTSSPNYYPPRSPYSIGRNWETDQCV